MKKKIILLLLALLLCVGLCGCSGAEDVDSIEEIFHPVPDVDADLIYEQLVRIGEQGITIPSVVDAVYYRYRLDTGCKEEINLLFLVSNEFLPDLNDADLITDMNGIYMVDLDTQQIVCPWEIDLNEVTIEGQGWNMSTRESASICLFNFFINHYIHDTARIWRDEETIIWATQETIHTVRELYSAERYDALVQTFPIVQELGGVSMTAREMMDLIDAEPEVIQEKIKTAGDIFLYIIVADVRDSGGDLQGFVDGEYWHWNMCAEEVLQCRTGCCGSLSNLAMYLLDGDYEDMGFINHTYYPGGSGGHLYVYILYEGNYFIVDYSAIVFEGKTFLYTADINRMPLVKLNSLEEWPERIGEMYPADEICLIQYEPNSKMHLPVNYDEANGEFWVPEGSEYVVLYQPEDGYRLVEKPFEADWYDWNTWGQVHCYPHVKAENIKDFKISKELGGVTLTVEEANALVDAAPEVVQGKVKTAGDVVMYMLAADMSRGGFDVQNLVNGMVWHWNSSAKEVMERRLGGCGSQANLAMYLLEGDYEEIGFIDHVYPPDGDGGHITNYIVYQGEYYAIDFSNYYFSNYWPDGEYAIVPMDSLEEYPKLAEQRYGEIDLIFAYSGAKRHYPCVYYDKEAVAELELQREDIWYDTYFYPEGVEYTVLYDSGDGYRLDQIPFDTTFFDWTVYW